MTLEILLGSKAGSNLAFSASDFTNTNRAGEQFVLVGPILVRSYKERIMASLTSLSCHPFILLASPNTRFKASSSRGLVRSFKSLNFSCAAVTICFCSSVKSSSIIYSPQDS